MPGNRDFEVRLDKRRLEQLIRQSPGDADDAVEAVAREGEAIVKGSFNTSPPGRSYRRGGRVHVASQPGQPPNIDTGRLMNAIHVYRPRALARIISTGDVEYAPHLEFGTVKMAARPFMRPMAVKLRKLAPDIMKRFIARRI